MDKLVYPPMTASFQRYPATVSAMHSMTPDQIASVIILVGTAVFVVGVIAIAIWLKR